MASEIRVDKINSLSGVGTVTLSPTGVDISGITTVQTLKVGTGVTASEDGDIFFTGVCTATTFAGSGANLTALPAANLSGTLPAISAANLTNVPAANVTGTLPAISGANLTSLTAANLSGALPAISAASCTSIPAANIVGLATAGFERSGGFGGGKILQTVSTSDNATVTASGTTLQLLTASITPAATSSKILILSTLSCQGVPSSNVYGVHKLMRGSISGTEIFNTSAGQNSSFYNYMNIVINYMDSPNTTSATSYTTGINRNSGGTSTVSSDGTTYTLILMEIGA